MPSSLLSIDGFIFVYAMLDVFASAVPGGTLPTVTLSLSFRCYGRGYATVLNCIWYYSMVR